MRQPVRIGFIGCGGHSGRHADVVLRIPDDFKIVGAVDIKEGVAENFLASRGVHALATTKLSEFMAIEDMDAVLIGTPHSSHLDLCNKILFMWHRGTHIFCEKPLWEGPHQDEGRLIIEEAAKRVIVFSSCHPRRYEREFIYIKAYLPMLITKYGKPLEVRFQFFYHEPSTEWKRFSGYRRLKSRTFRNELEIVFEAGRARVESALDSSTGIVKSTFSSFPFDINAEGSGSPHHYRFRPHQYDDSLTYITKNFAATIRGTELYYLTFDDLITNTSICNELVAHEYAAISCET
ncbi:MAG: Gfo/Idh/MocA family oxidoreductase [Candidatus Colwellbacteria bacterium]|nr:Gfo/Idh/MocA family oxidoreductase [Candidatus Colwellbacteria bacterium]